jgi:hypothetical protein
MTALRRAMTPYTPMQNNTAARSKKFAANIACQSFRERTMAPMAAASRTNEMARNGIR